MTHTVVSSATKEVVIGFDRPFVVIGERINPTGRKLLAAEMAAGDYSRVRADRSRIHGVIVTQKRARYVGVADVSVEGIVRVEDCGDTALSVVRIGFGVALFCDNSDAAIGRCAEGETQASNAGPQYQNVYVDNHG